MALYQRGGVWWADLYHEGTRIRRSTGETDRRKAKAAHDALAADCHRRPRGQYRFSDALTLWEQERPRTKRGLIFSKLLLEYHGDCDLAEVSPESVRQGIGAMVPGSYNRYLSVIKRSLVLAKRAGWLQDVPELELRSGATQRTDWLTHAEWQTLREFLLPHHRCAADFAIATGLRLANVIGLQWRWVGKDSLHLPPEIMKGRKALTVPLSGSAKAVLQAQRDRHPDLVFPGVNGTRMSDFSDTFKRAATRAGVPWATFHTLRHTWASWHIQNGTPLEVLQRLGGWATITMVMRYAHHAPSQIAAWADNAGALTGHSTAGKHAA